MITDTLNFLQTIAKFLKINNKSAVEFYIAFQHQVVSWNKMVILNDCSFAEASVSCVCSSLH
jgi:hypothetical protein